MRFGSERAERAAEIEHCRCELAEGIPNPCIVKVDPNVELHWSEIRRGAWEARCVCSVQYHYEPLADERVRLDPLDPSTGRHFGQCEHRDTTDPALLRVLLKVREGAGGGDYWYVTCGACEAEWQVPHHAAERVG